MAMPARLGKYSRMRVVDVMTRNALTVTPSDTVGRAEELMYENNIRQLPVVEGNELVGIITDRDIRSFLSHSLFASAEERDRTMNVKVRGVMITEPISVLPDDDLQYAVELLIEEKMGGIPVVDYTEGLVGIITYVDVLRCFLYRLHED